MEVILNFVENYLEEEHITFIAQLTERGNECYLAQRSRVAVSLPSRALRAAPTGPLSPVKFASPTGTERWRVERS